jgi:hypothetical protein
MAHLAIPVALVGLAILAAAVPSRATAAAAAEVVTVTEAMPLGEAFEKGFLARDIQMAPDGRSAILYDLTLVEDDGPGACGDFQYGVAAPTAIRGDLQVKKVLRVDRAEVLDARVVLSVRPQPEETAPLAVAVNGRELTLEVAQFKATENDWPTVRIPAGLLNQADNEIVLSCRGQKGWWITVAQRQFILANGPERKDRPNRSFRSTDGGRTWSPGLGDDGRQDGELMVRLNLAQYAAQGELIGPIVDLAARAGGKDLASDVQVKSLRLRSTGDVRDGTSIRLWVRSGDKPVYDPARWGEWLPCDAAGDARGDLKRFVQWRAVLATSKPKTTPVLQGVELQAQVQPQPPAWAANLKVLDAHNEEILYTSMPFEYEKFDEPALVELRTKYKLDEVVAGASSEIDKMIKLRNWVAAQWKYDPPIPYYPAWDAREILRLHKGFCVQFAIANMQCALSLGMQARFVFGHFPNVKLKGRIVSGHEVTEVWSNELGKWVMMDAQRNESFVSRKTGLLTGMWELHEDQLDTYFPKGVEVRGASFDDEVPSEGLLWWQGAEPTTRSEKPKLEIKWGYVQWVPRNNFYAHRFPEPLHQGLTWSWTGYWNLEDARTPRLSRYGRYTHRRSDIEWTLNQVRWAAAPAEQPGKVRLVMGTVTPDFDTFLVSTDGGEWRPSADTLNWPLHAGKNRVEMRVRNRAGVLGRKSWLEVEYP